MNTKQTKKSLKASGLALLVSIVMLVGTTFAWFTDTITNSGNTIQSGSLDVTLEEWDGNEYVDASSTPIFNYDRWEPGYTDVAAVKIGNKGSLSLKYKVDFVSRDAGADANKLAKVIDVYYLKDAVAPDKLPESFDALADKGFVKLGTLADFLNKEDGAAKGELDPEEVDYAMIALHMQESADNEYQGLNIGDGFDIVINATQLNKETDGFGNPDYDKDAQNPVLVSTASDLSKAISDGRAVKLQKNITVRESLTIERKSTIDLNGNTLTKSGAGHLIQVIENGSVAIKNGSLNSSNNNAILIVEGASDVNLENCNLKYTGALGYGVITNGTNSKESKLTMTGCTITSPKNYACYFPAGEILLKDCTVTGAVIISGGDVTIDGGTYNADGFSGQPKIWNKIDTINYMKKFSTMDGCGHMGDSVLIMDRRSKGYDMKSVTIKNATFNTELTLTDGSKANAYAIKYVDYNNKEGESPVKLNISGNTYNHKLAGGEDPLMFIGIDGSDITM